MLTIECEYVLTLICFQKFFLITGQLWKGNKEIRTKNNTKYYAYPGLRWEFVGKAGEKSSSTRLLFHHSLTIKGDGAATQSPFVTVVFLWAICCLL